MNIRRIKLSADSFAVKLIVLALAAFTFTSAADGQGSYQADIQWQTDVEVAKKMAIEQNKLVLLHFGACWCRPCRSLETFVFKSKAVKDAIAENVVPVKLDADQALDLVNEYDVQIVPFDIVITPGGRIISERRSPADSGNYAKMIASTSNASRSLEKEKAGPIAHQRTIAKTKLVSKPGVDTFRPKAPGLEEFGLSKDSSRLQRKQEAFSMQGTAQRQTNPWVAAKRNRAAEKMNVASNGGVLDNVASPAKLETQQSTVAATPSNRPVKPKRIINERYFAARGITPKTIAARTQSTSQSSNKIETADIVESDYIVESSNAVETTIAPPANNPLQTARKDAGNNPFKLVSARTTPDAVEVQILENETENSPLVLPESTELQQNQIFVAPTEESNSVTAETPKESQSLDLELNLDAASTGTSPEPQIAQPAVEFALRGKCPVTLITEGRWTDGDPQFGIVHRDRTYVFATAEKLNLFRQNPDGYSPVLAGFDPVVYQEEKKLVDGKVEHGVFMGRTPNQQVILFKDAATRSKFQNDPHQFLQTVRQATLQTNGNMPMMR